MTKIVLSISFISLFLTSCGDNAGGNKSIFSTKEAESGVYSKEVEPENEAHTVEEKKERVVIKDSLINVIDSAKHEVHK